MNLILAGRGFLLGPNGRIQLAERREGLMPLAKVEGVAPPVSVKTHLFRGVALAALFLLLAPWCCVWFVRGLQFPFASLGSVFAASAVGLLKVNSTGKEMQIV